MTNQPDRELLEHAAKAAGMEGWKYAHRNDVAWGFERSSANGITTFWNPLTDDGDALQLAVKLRLLVDINSYRSKATDGVVTEQNEEHHADPYAATRRAIVRAAATGAKP